MLLSQVFSPFAYAVGDEFPIEESVVEEIIETPEIVETEPTAEVVEAENPVGGEIVIENNEGLESNTGVVDEIPEIQAEISSRDTEILSWEQENLKEEIENLTWTEASSWFFETLKEWVKNLLGIWNDEKGETKEEFESKEIYWTWEYEWVKVEVYAQTWLFARWTELTIEPVVEEKLEAVQEVLLSWEDR